MEPSPGRRCRQKDHSLAERRRESLLAASATVFARCGYQDADVQEIADVCGVAKGTVYTYFPSKEELFLATVDLAMFRLNQEISAAVERIADPLDRIGIVMLTFFKHFRDHPDHTELLVIERAEYRDRTTPTYHEHRKTVCKKWEELYSDLIQKGRVRDIPIERILRVTSDLMYGTMFTNHFAGQKRTPEEQATDVVDILFNGILTPIEREGRGESLDFSNGP